MIKNKLLIFLTINSLVVSLQAQTMRYFEFSKSCGNGNWRDTSFIAAASNPVLIDTVLANINRPIDERKFIRGHISHGHGGYNRNAQHWFQWHFIPNQWDLVENAMEVCDGCAYTDIDLDTAYWLNVVKEFCPWGGIPVREIHIITGDKELKNITDIVLFPNPVRDTLAFKSDYFTNLTITVYNTVGQEILTTLINKDNPTINLNHLQSGVYFIKIDLDHKKMLKKIVIDKEN